ncbi:MerR family transcriptional regulator, partial [Roseisolibacter sp. H3M3-2]|uniref:MerR family transcriptional regulator n=1 Tax=Roseisolibacter sp. H3M3-2 TaxID=3031323 RepID=UPI0023DCD5BB
MPTSVVTPASPIHPIQVVVRRTGLSADVIRAWEKRHGVVAPVRSAVGRRLYSDADVERLRLIARATGGGRTVAQAAALPPDALAALVRSESASADSAGAVRRDADAASPAREHLQACLAAIGRFDGMELDAALRRATIALSAEAFLDAIVVHLWQQVGERVHDGTLRPSQQHLAQAVLRRALDRVTEAATLPGAAPDLVVATPPGQMQELGALLTAAAAATGGWRVVYLGPGLPAEDVAEAAVRTRAAAVAVSLGTVSGDRVVSRELRRLRTLLPAAVAIVVEGGATDAYGSVLRAIRADVARDVRTLLTRLRALRSERARATPDAPAGARRRARRGSTRGRP